jgi:ribosomal silencing factor RsfS
MHEKMMMDKGKWGIIGTGYSNRHIFKVGKSLVAALRELNVEWPNEPRIFGRKDDEWIMVGIGPQMNLHLLTENLREDVDLEAKWDSFHTFIEEGEVEERRKNPFKFRSL